MVSTGVNNFRTNLIKAGEFSFEKLTFVVQPGSAGRCLSWLRRCRPVPLPLGPSLPAADDVGGGCGGRSLAFRGRAAPG